MADEIARLRALLSERDEEIRQLKSIISADAAAIVLPPWIPHLEKRNAEVLRLLIARPFVDIRIANALIWWDKDVEYNNLSAQIFRIRKALGQVGVLVCCRLRTGEYYLPPEEKIKLKSPEITWPAPLEVNYKSKAAMR